jgi:hypothetical protein
MKAVPADVQRRIIDGLDPIAHVWATTGSSTRSTTIGVTCASSGLAIAGRCIGVCRGWVDPRRERLGRGRWMAPPAEHAPVDRAPPAGFLAAAEVGVMYVCRRGRPGRPRLARGLASLRAVRPRAARRVWPRELRALRMPGNRPRVRRPARHRLQRPTSQTRPWAPRSWRWCRARRSRRRSRRAISSSSTTTPSTACGRWSWNKPGAKRHSPPDGSTPTPVWSATRGSRFGDSGEAEERHAGERPLHAAQPLSARSRWIIVSVSS